MLAEDDGWEGVLSVDTEAAWEKENAFFQADQAELEVDV
jgi:hypothetical protein